MNDGDLKSRGKRDVLFVRPRAQRPNRGRLQILGRDCTWLPRAFTSRPALTVNPKYQPPLFNWHRCVMVITARSTDCRFRQTQPAGCATSPLPPRRRRARPCWDAALWRPISGSASQSVFERSRRTQPSPPVSTEVATCRSGVRAEERRGSGRGERAKR
jgi:hypothetical protein